MASKTVPTKNNLMAAKKSLSLAKTGYDLMDKKKNILVREIMGMLERASTIRQEIEETYKRAYDALVTAQLAMGDCMDAARNIPIDDSLNVVYRSVMGAELPTNSVAEPSPSPAYGLYLTDSKLDEAYREFLKVKVLTVELAQVETCVYRLTDAIKKTQKRTNALGNIMIPKLSSDIKFISDALDEKEREDFSRLKVLKKRD